MPELPEVETTKLGLQPSLLYQTIKCVLVRNNKLRWPVPSDLNEILIGNKIIDVERRAKYLLIKFASGTLIVHLGMSGSLRLVKEKENAKEFLKHEHIIFYISNGYTLRYHDPRRFGCILWSPDDVYKHPLLVNLGIEPLTNELNDKYLYELVKNKSANIKTVIMNAKYIVGIGNIYACESLFYAKIHPMRSAYTLSLLDCKKLVLAIKNVLQTSINIGGTTLKDFVNTKGEPGYFSQKLAVYGKAGQNCNVCGEIINLIIIGQRRTDFCSSCQI